MGYNKLDNLPKKKRKDDIDKINLIYKKIETPSSHQS